MANNRNKGNGYERKLCKELRIYFPDILTARNESRATDARGIDFCYTDKFAIQAKCGTSFGISNLNDWFDHLLSKPKEIKLVMLNHQVVGGKGEYVFFLKKQFDKLEYYLARREDFEAITIESKSYKFDKLKSEFTKSNKIQLLFFIYSRNKEIHEYVILKKADFYRVLDNINLL
jgi:hypothetical protein